MLIDNTNGKLKEAILFAKRTARWNDGQNQLRSNIIFLSTYACRGSELGNKKTRCQLYPDFDNLSFYFVMEATKDGKEYKRWFNGGLIFHGSHDGFGSGSAPTFSVCLNPTDGWSIHT